ncbi:hypothetical protein PP1_006630 [Pseudonocardia sp. P1]
MSVPRRRRALLIGNEIHHNDRWTRLPSARVDRDELRAVLSEPTIGGFDVEVLADLDALRMRAAITNFCQESVDDELLLLYVSGHGAVRPDGEFAFVATDTDPHDLTGTGISATFVNNCLEDSYAAQKVALFDTCQSGAFTSGFRTRPTKGVSTTPLTRTAPVRPRGVYVLASSDVDEYSFSGPIDESGNPTASVFTDAVVKVLSSGSAGTTGGGFVSVDDLYDAVHQRLLGLEPPQTPLKSSDHVVGSIVIAARPSGRTSAESRVGEEASARSFAATARESDDDAGVAPDWSRLLGYYADIVRADTTRPGLMAVDGDDYVDLTGSERVLRGVLDPDGTVPVPEGADALIESARSEHGPTLWAGWPTVVLHRSAPSGTQSGQPLCAPLLIRRVEVVDDGGAVRLRPISDVVPHPGLVSSCLEEDEAARLLWSYRPSWHFGESARMATDADQLLRDPFGLPSVEQLRPEHLAGRVDIATPGEGARNAAILFGLPTSSAAKGLLKDYVQIIARPTSIAGTALAALHPDTSTDDVPKAEVSLVTPLPGNDAQEAVIRCAMTRRLTVATGPPGRERVNSSSTRSRQPPQPARVSSSHRRTTRPSTRLSNAVTGSPPDSWSAPATALHVRENRPSWRDCSEHRNPHRTWRHGTVRYEQPTGAGPGPEMSSTRSPGARTSYSPPNEPVTPRKSGSGRILPRSRAQPLRAGSIEPPRSPRPVGSVTGAGVGSFGLSSGPTQLITVSPHSGGSTMRTRRPATRRRSVLP